MGTTTTTFCTILSRGDEKSSSFLLIRHGPLEKEDLNQHTKLQVCSIKRTTWVFV